jgi:hypothetical protein
MIPEDIANLKKPQGAKLKNGERHAAHRAAAAAAVGRRRAGAPGETLRMHGQGAPLGYPSVSCLSSLGVNVKRWRNPASLQRVKCPCPSCQSVKTQTYTSSVSPAGSWLIPRRQVLIKRLTSAIAGGTGVVAAVHLAASRLMLKACFSCAARSPLTQDFNKLRAASDFATILHSATQKCC